MQNLLTTIATFEYAHFAHLAKAKLASEGIKSVVLDEHTATMNWFYTNAIGGIKLKVLTGDVDKALKILNENEIGINESFTKDIDEAEEVIICPYCQSINVIDERYLKKWAYVSILFLGFPLLFKRKRYLCIDCRYKWRKEK